MKPIRQQRAGRGYLSSVLSDATRPYEFRGGLRRLLNAGNAMPMRAAYAYGSLPFNLKYLQHSAYGYGNEWSERLTPAPTVAAVSPDNVSAIPERLAPASTGHGGYKTKTESLDFPARGNQHKPEAHASPAEGNQRKAEPLDSPAMAKQRPGPAVEPAAPVQQQQPRASASDNERSRLGPPPIVTSRPVERPVGDLQSLASISSENDIDNSGNNAVVKPGSKQAPVAAAARNQVLGRLARQLEEHNFGDRRPAAEHQPASGDPRSETSMLKPVSASPPMDTVFSQQDRPPAPGQPRADAPGTEYKTNRPAPPDRVASFATRQDRKESASVLSGSPEHAPLQERSRLMKNLEKQAVVAPRASNPAGPDVTVPGPVKAGKKPPAFAVQKPAPVVRRAVVRRTAVPAFWERSYLSHARLRLYK